MGSYDGAEVCELEDTFILSKLGNIDKKNTGLYGDDRLVVLSNMNAWGMEKIKSERLSLKYSKNLDSNSKKKTSLKQVPSWTLRSI